MIIKTLIKFIFLGGAGFRGDHNGRERFGSGSWWRKWFGTDL